MPLGLFWQPALLEVITRNPVRGHLLRKLSPVCTSHPNPGLGLYLPPLPTPEAEGSLPKEWIQGEDKSGQLFPTRAGSRVSPPGGTLGSHHRESGAEDWAVSVSSWS